MEFRDVVPEDWVEVGMDWLAGYPLDAFPGPCGTIEKGFWADGNAGFDHERSRIFQTESLISASINYNTVLMFKVRHRHWVLQIRSFGQL